MIAKHVLNIHRTAGNAPERDDTDKKVLAASICLPQERAAIGICIQNQAEWVRCLADKTLLPTASGCTHAGGGLSEAVPGVLPLPVGAGAV